MKDRIKELRKKLKISQDSMANALNVTRTYISLVETGDRNLSDRTIKDICRIYNINETWLRTGEGDMLAPTTREQELADISAQLFKMDDSDFKARLIKCISKMDAEKIRLLEQIVNELAAEEQNNNK